MTREICPFRVGDIVLYCPTAVGQVSMADVLPEKRPQQGERYIISGFRGDFNIILKDLEGGLAFYWGDFISAEPDRKV